MLLYHYIDTIIFGIVNIIYFPSCHLRLRHNSLSFFFQGVFLEYFFPRTFLGWIPYSSTFTIKLFQASFIVIFPPSSTHAHPEVKLWLPLLMEDENFVSSLSVHTPLIWSLNINLLNLTLPETPSISCKVPYLASGELIIYIREHYLVTGFSLKTFFFLYFNTCHSS